MSFGKKVDELIDALRVLPGVGQKTAQRMALSLLDGDRSGARRLAAALDDAQKNVTHCVGCRNLTQSQWCVVCEDESRKTDVLCVVESPADLLAIEQTGQYRGLYFVLSGSLSPLDGLGPEEIGIPQFNKRLSELDIKEIIVATNPTMEGEATAHYIASMYKERYLVTRLAHGIPLGGSLGFVDGGTLSHAFTGRHVVDV